MSVHGELELQRTEGQAIARRDESPLEALIVRGMNDPSFDVDKLERLMALMERKEAQSRKELFEAALLRVQKKAPRIAQHGMMDRGVGKGQIPYAKREDIDAVMRPIYQEEGFTVTWDGPPGLDGKIDVTGFFTCCGHTEVRHWPCSPDASGGKTGPQAVSSTIAYGKRQISKMVWDIIEEGLDKNGAKRQDVEPITQAQADEINSALEEVGAGVNTPRRGVFNKTFGVTKLEELKAGQLREVYARIKSVRDQR